MPVSLSVVFQHYEGRNFSELKIEIYNGQVNSQQDAKEIFLINLIHGVFFCVDNDLNYCWTWKSVCEINHFNNTEILNKILKGNRSL